MRHTELTTCDLSCNVITKIPPKFVLKFSLLTGKNETKRFLEHYKTSIIMSYIDLNLSHNNMSKLPDELADLLLLQILNIAHNSFITLPPVVFKMKKLKELKACDNQIIG